MHKIVIPNPFDLSVEDRTKHISDIKKAIITIVNYFGYTDCVLLDDFLKNNKNIVIIDGIPIVFYFYKDYIRIVSFDYDRELPMKNYQFFQLYYNKIIELEKIRGKFKIVIAAAIKYKHLTYSINNNEIQEKYNQLVVDFNKEYNIGMNVLFTVDFGFAVKICRPEYCMKIFVLKKDNKNKYIVYNHSYKNEALCVDNVSDIIAYIDTVQQSFNYFKKLLSVFVLFCDGYNYE